MGAEGEAAATLPGAAACTSGGGAGSVAAVGAGGSTGGVGGAGSAAWARIHARSDTARVMVRSLRRPAIRVRYPRARPGGGSPTRATTRTAASRTSRGGSTRRRRRLIAGVLNGRWLTRPSRRYNRRACGLRARSRSSVSSAGVRRRVAERWRRGGRERRGRTNGVVGANGAAGANAAAGIERRGRGRGNVGGGRVRGARRERAGGAARRLRIRHDSDVRQRAPRLSRLGRRARHDRHAGRERHGEGRRVLVRDRQFSLLPERNAPRVLERVRHLRRRARERARVLHAHPRGKLAPLGVGRLRRSPCTRITTSRAIPGWGQRVAAAISRTRRCTATDPMRFDPSAADQWMHVVMSASAFDHSRGNYHFYAARAVAEDLTFFGSLRQFQPVFLSDRGSGPVTVDFDEFRLVTLPPTASICPPSAAATRERGGRRLHRARHDHEPHRNGAVLSPRSSRARSASIARPSRSRRTTPTT